MNDSIYKIANFSFYNGAQLQNFQSVGMRIKGGASRGYVKKSWKISFNHFDKGRTWGQMKKIQLKAGSMEPTFTRELASASVIKSMGAPAIRGSYANLFINGVSWGTYLLLEDPGTDEFLKSRLTGVI
tara:strand:+ start:331 stop:714 length:384 start_codon:yes stop_codon:yes gene_type:complete